MPGTKGTWTVTDRSAPVTVAQAERIVLSVLRMYGSAIVRCTPTIARPHVKRVVDEVGVDLEDLVGRAVEDAVGRAG